MKETWYEEIFDEDYLRGYSHLTPELSERQADAIARILELEPGARVLDLPCGQGRHATVLQARGIRVAGMDLSACLLGKAREAGAVGLARCDMRRVPLADGCCDAAYNVFTSFGFFADEEDDLEALREVRRVLRPGGRLLLEVINRDALFIPGYPYPHRLWTRGDGLHLLDEIEFDPERSRFLNRRLVIRDDGSRREIAFSVRAYAPHELREMVEAAGLSFVRFLPGLKPDEEYDTVRSRRLAILACK